MATPGRLVPLLDQFDWARERLHDRIAGPAANSGDGAPVEVPPLTDDEYIWTPVAKCWTVRLQSDGPGPGATYLVGMGEWGREGAWPRPWPPPFTTLAWRMSHLSEMLSMRADHTVGTHSMTQDTYRISGTAEEAVAALDAGLAVWREALVSATDEDLDLVGRSTYPNGSDPEDQFLQTVWWVNQEVLHHGAEIALLRDLYRDRQS